MKTKYTPWALASILLLSWANPARAQEGICAEVRLRLTQDVIVARDAFEATLLLENASQADVELVDAELTITNDAGVRSEDVFALIDPVFDGPPTIPAGGTLAVRWTLVPLRSAAPEAPTQFDIGGSFTLAQQGQLRTTPLFPVGITVMPTPILRLKYFWQRTVLSDDPFTQVVECAVPFSIGMQVVNEGAGFARDFRVETGQPEIVENDRDLLIDFELIGAEVDGTSFGDGFLATVGDVEPNSTRVLRYLLTASLQGVFREYEASFTHETDLGEPIDSIIESVAIFPLIRAVAADNPGGPVVDFLTDEFDDPNFLFLPDTLHLADGSVEPVTPVVASGAQFVQVSPSSMPEADSAWQTQVSMPPGRRYLRLPDPANEGESLVGLIRDDGKFIPAGANLWQTDRAFEDPEERPVLRRELHLIESGGARSTIYTFLFVENTSVSGWRSVASHGPAGEAGIDLNPDGSTVESRASGVSQLQVAFSAPVNADTFLPTSVTVTGTDSANLPVDLSGISVDTAIGADGTIGIITFMPQLPDMARYCVRLDGVKDIGGNLVASGVEASVVALRGDVNGDLRVNGADVAFVRATRDGLGGPFIDPDITDQVRADITTDGRVNGADVSFTRSFNGNDVRSISDPCITTEGPDSPPNGGADSLVVNGAATVGVGVIGEAQLAEADSDRELDPLERLAEEAGDWQPVDAAFAAEGVTIRLDPCRFVVGGAADGVDPIAMLTEASVGIEQMSMLGFENWMLV